LDLDSHFLHDYAGSCPDVSGSLVRTAVERGCPKRGSLFFCLDLDSHFLHDYAGSCPIPPELKLVAIKQTGAVRETFTGNS
ncbi:MAG: hypothetical protein AB7W47_18005, partial [Calditrichaceae bacterium]